MRIPFAGALLCAAVLSSGCAGAASAPAPAPTLPSGLAPKGQTVEGTVTRVVDGDTVHVDVDGQDVTVRMIGINTPETVKPGAPVECFGPEASEFAKETLTGAPVTLEFDASQGLTDRYDRTLAYVWRGMADSPVLFNLEAVARGFAYERQYGSTPYAWSQEFRAASREAKAQGRGLWGACQ